MLPRLSSSSSRMQRRVPKKPETICVKIETEHGPKNYYFATAVSMPSPSGFRNCVNFVLCRKRSALLATSDTTWFTTRSATGGSCSSACCANSRQVGCAKLMTKARQSTSIRSSEACKSSTRTRVSFDVSSTSSSTKTRRSSPMATSSSQEKRRPL